MMFVIGFVAGYVLAAVLAVLACRGEAVEDLPTPEEEEEEEARDDDRLRGA